MVCIWNGVGKCRQPGDAPVTGSGVPQGYRYLWGNCRVSWKNQGERKPCCPLWVEVLGKASRGALSKVPEWPGTQGLHGHVPGQVSRALPATGSVTFSLCFSTRFPSFSGEGLWIGGSWGPWSPFCPLRSCAGFVEACWLTRSCLFWVNSPGPCYIYLVKLHAI